VKGTVERSRRDQEGGSTVLRFVLAQSDGSRVAVEMRGDEIRGVLDDGDRVVVETGLDAAMVDGVQRPLRLRNESTGSLVVAWQRPWLMRALKPLPTLLTSAVISTGVTIVLTALADTSDGSTTPESGVSPPAPEDPDPLIVPVTLVLTGLYWALWFGAFGRRWRAKGRPSWPVLLGLFVGAAGPAALLL
jgi:hypothetical protein